MHSSSTRVEEPVPVPTISWRPKATGLKYDNFYVEVSNQIDLCSCGDPCSCVSSVVFFRILAAGLQTFEYIRCHPRS
jgi:hypothetical protein